jgi:hypothetical protein
MVPRIYLLIKIFDKREYADAFINQGEMFCRALGSFKRSEDSDFRGDIHEGITDWHQPDKIKLTISYKDKDGVEQVVTPTLAGPVITGHSGFDHLKLFCMYSISIENAEANYETEAERIELVRDINNRLKIQSTLNEKAVALGEFAVVIHNVNEFINKVNAMAQALNARCFKGLIEYYDPKSFSGNFEGIEAVFRKRKTYAHQNEYRFAFDIAEKDDDAKIHIGPLTNLALMLPTNDINSKLVVRFEESRDA